MGKNRACSRPSGRASIDLERLDLFDLTPRPHKTIGLVSVPFGGKTRDQKSMDRNNLRRAIEHPVNYRPIVLCTIALMAVGILMLVFGIVALLVDHIELGPPHFDEHYERYQNSSMPHIIGKSMLRPNANEYQGAST